MVTESFASSVDPGASSTRRRRGGAPPSPSASSRASLFTRFLAPRAPATRTGASLPKEHLARSHTTQLWLQSRLLSSTSPTFRQQGEDRPITFDNIKLSLRLLSLVWIRFLSFFWNGQGLRMCLFLVGKVVKGILPAARIWAASQMLDMVQRSFEDGVMDKREVWRVAAISMVFSGSDDIFSFFAQNNDNVIKNHINYSMEKAYLEAQLSLSIPSLSSPFLSALMYEAGVFAGFESRTSRQGHSSNSGGPFQILQSSFSVLTILIEVLTQAGLLIRTISSATSTDSSASSLLLIVLSLSPSLFRILGSFASSGVGTKGNKRMNWMRSRKDERAIKDLGRNGGYKQEIVLFGLKDWVMEKWDKLKIEQLNAQEMQKQQMGIVELGLGMGQEGAQTAFYVLLALRSLSTSLSLGSIRLYQSTAGSLLASLRNLTRVLESSYQSVFYLAAFCEAIDQPELEEIKIRRGGDANRLPMLDYETVRVSGGMKIEARNMGFTYPGTDKPTLRNINLTVNPGETLAIVGFNGGGKTTLVKALMGLYDHTGTLRINSVPVEELSPHSLHARTSCLFQDYSKYSLSLRENVGVGNTERLHDIPAIGRAIERGGAEAIRDKIGLEGQLNRYGVPDSLGEGNEGGNTGGNEIEELVPIPPPPGGGGPPRGGGPGRGGGRSGGGSLLGGHGGGGPPPGGPPPGFPGPPPEILDLMERSQKDEKRAALSGGQWQRVALARAFLRADEADLVVFDEPSSALDPRAESELFQRIHSLSMQDGKRKSTTIYISHRFSTVRKADQIAVVEDGTIVECGSHSDLMALNGRYHELFTLSKEGYED
ncbi:hypothetical protein P7C73_g6120, partial [Tremellales sp. Uapishka_1]